MKKIAMIAVFGKSIAVWNALKKHIDLMSLAGYNIDVYVREGQDLSLIQKNYESRIIYYSSLSELKFLISKDKSIDRIWCPNLLVVIQIKLMRIRKKIMFWVQGTLPEESYVRNHNLLRKKVLSFLEYMAFYFSSEYIFVSEKMAEFYMKKYPIKNKKYIVVPCLSEFEDCFYSNENRIANSFVYLGGLSKWQCFEEVLSIYKNISSEKTVLHIITLEVDKAQKIVDSFFTDKTNIKIYSVTNRNDLPNILSQFEYGFLIRRESPVNYVASPIKFLEYISCGVNVIMTNAIPSYAEVVRKYKIGSVIDIDNKEPVILPYSPLAKEVYRKEFSMDKFVKCYQYLF